VQALFEQGVLVRNGTVTLARQLDEIRVPTTVQAILASRIDRLPGPEKELLQILAVLGREFPLGLIKRVAARRDDELERMLSELQSGEFIYEQPAMADIEYEFKHALTQEVAYNSLLTERREMLHEHAGQAIEALYVDHLEDHLTELARHHDRGGNVPKAVEYLGRAAQRAAWQAAHSEAVNCLNRALELLQRLPEGTDRDRRELDLQMALNLSLFALSPEAPERERALLRVQHLAQQLGERERLMEGLLHLGLFRMLWQQYGAAQELANRVLALADPATDRKILAGAHLALGLTFFYRGELQASREHLELAGAPLNAQSSRGVVAVEYAENATASLSTTLLMLGYPETARRISRDLVAAMRRSSNPVSLYMSLNRQAIVHRLLRDSGTTLELAEEALSIARDLGMTIGVTLAGFMRGRALADEGRGEEGIAEMSRAIASLRGNAVVSMYYGNLAETLGQYARVADGLAAVATGLNEVERSGSKFSLPHLYQVHGELLLLSETPDAVEAEHWLRMAIDIARSQQARFWELRATTSLARLLKSKGRKEEARTILADIYNWFTEGFDTADLKNAKALLEELEG
jgi:tetratricopeptide (TPR) repeat protein